MKAKILSILGGLGLGVLYGIAMSTCVAAGISLDRRLYQRALDKAAKKNVQVMADVMKETSHEKHDQ